jgi:hypothetical protein
VQIVDADRKLSPTIQVLLAIIGGVLLVVGLGLAVRKILTFENWPEGTDISIYLAAAKAIAHDQTPYFPAPGTDPWPYKSAYPPLFGEFVNLLTGVLGTGRGWIVWSLTGPACLFASVVLMTRSFKPKLPVAVVLLICGAFATSHIFRNETFHGQVNFLTAFLIVSGAVLWQRGNNIAAALPWAIAIVTKPFIGIIVLFLLRKGDFRATSATLGASASLFFGSFLFAFSDPVAIFKDWRAASHWYTSAPTVAYPDNEALYGFLTRLFVDTKFSTPIMNIPAAPAILIIPIVALAAYIFLQAVDTRQHKNEDDWPRTLLEIGITLGLFMACGPFTENDHVFVLLPGLFGAVLMCIQSADRRWLIAAGLWAFAFVSLVLPVGVYQFMPPYWPKLEGLAILRSIHYGLAFYVAATYSGLLLWSERQAQHDSSQSGLSSPVPAGPV